MEKLVKYILFFIFIKVSFSIVPVWNFSSSALELFEDNLKEYYYNIVNKTSFLNMDNYYLTRSFKVNDEYKLIKENHLFLDGNYYGTKNYSDLGSVYLFKDCYYICPKGKFHVEQINRIDNSSKSLYDQNFTEDDNWDLQCFYQHHNTYENNDEGHKFLFIFYIGTNSNISVY